MQKWLITGEDRGWQEPLGSLQKSLLQLKHMEVVLWVHGDFYAQAFGVLLASPKTNWSFLPLCSCVSHPEGSHWWEVSWCFLDEQSWPQVAGGLRRCVQLVLYLCVQTVKKMNTVSRTENITVGFRNPLLSLPLPWTLNVVLSKLHTPNFSAVGTSYFLLYVGATSHCGGQN